MRLPVSGLTPEHRELAEAIAAILLENRRAIKVGEQRVNVKPRRPSGYIYLYPEELIDTAITGVDWRILMILASKADTRGLVVYAVPEIAGRAGIANSQFHRAIKNLVNAGVIKKVARGAVQLNPRVLWRGASSTQIKLLVEQLGDRTLAELRADGVL